MLEWMDRESVRLLRERYPEIPAAACAAVLVEQMLDGLPGEPLDEWVDRMDSAGALEDSWFGETAQDRERFRVLRHALPEIVNDRVRRAGFQKMSTDFAVPVECGEEMMSCYRERLDALFPCKSVIFGHIGDAHVHINILPESDDDVRRGKDLIGEFARRAVAMGGTVSAEHGLGKKKAWMLELEFTPGQIESMRAVKRRLDPNWILGRGTLFACNQT
jgi:FAD/FMN-containing dehydrogenase